MKACGIFLPIQGLINDGEKFMSIRITPLNRCIMLCLLGCCVTCVSQIVPTTPVSPYSNSATPTNFVLSTSQLTTNTSQLTDSVTATLIPPTPSAISLEPTETSALSVTVPYTASSLFSIVPYTKVNMLNLLSDNIEPNIYMLAHIFPEHVDEQTTSQIWRYSLEQDAYDAILSWPLTNLADSLPDAYEAQIASSLGVTRTRLADLKTLAFPIDLSLSPDRQYLAFTTVTWVYGLEYNDAFIGYAVKLLDLSTNSMLEIVHSWDGFLGVTDFQWSPNSDKLAFHLAGSADIYALCIYELHTKQVLQLSQLTAIAKDNGYDTMLWDTSSEKLILNLRQHSDPFHLWVYDTVEQMTQRLEIPNITGSWVNNVFRSTANDVWIVHRKSQERVWLAQLNLKTGTVEVLAEVQDTLLAMPQVRVQSNIDNTLFAYERRTRVGDRSLRVFDVNRDEDFIALDATPYSWEWSSLTNIILVSFKRETDFQSPIGLVDVENEVIFALPLPPLDEYESIKEVTW